MINRPTKSSPGKAQSPLPELAAGVPHRLLLRSSTNKVLGGVCGGLAEYTNTDPLLWRVGFVALALMGAGILVYPVLWLLMPAAGPDGSTTSGLHETLRKGRSPRS
jgi:phage shock protein PspC (stress-responsive transcriptional regulator)